MAANRNNAPISSLHRRQGSANQTLAILQIIYIPVLFLLLCCCLLTFNIFTFIRIAFKFYNNDKMNIANNEMILL